MVHQWHIREDRREAECELALVSYVNTLDGGVRVSFITPRQIEGKDEVWAALIAEDAEAVIMSLRQSERR